MIFRRSALNNQPRHRSLVITASAVNPGSTVLVAGATGGVGQVLTAKLLEKGYKVRAMSRSEDKVRTLLGEAPNLSVVYGDMRTPSTLPKAVEGVDAICCCTGTTAFPSKRWADNNGPEQTDFIGVRNLIQATPKSLGRFIITTSAGVERYDQIPYSILNLFGVLKYKRMAEEALQGSGIPYTLIRPGRLTDGPYTSYDLNTLLKGIAGTRQDVQLSLKDELDGETSRIAVAEAIVQALALESTQGKAFAITSTEGDGPGQDAGKWKALFESVIGAAKV